MRRLAVALAALMLLGTACGGDDQQVVVKFDSDPDGWTIVGDADEAVDANVGNGALVAEDNVTGAFWYWNAPADFLDGSVFGGTLSFDARYDTTSTSTFNAADVIVSSGDLEVWMTFDDPPGTEWRRFTVPLDLSTDWRLGPLGRDVEDPEGGPADEDVLRDVFASPDALLIRGEFISGPDTGYLDNVAIGTFDRDSLPPVDE